MGGMMLYAFVLAIIIAIIIVVFHYFIYGMRPACVTVIKTEEDDEMETMYDAKEKKNEGLNDVVSKAILPNEKITRAEHNKYLWNSVQSADRTREPFGLKESTSASFITPYRFVAPRSEHYQNANSLIMQSKYGRT